MGGILSIMNASLNANLAPVLRAVADSGVLHSSELQLVAGAVVTVLLWEASSRKFSAADKPPPRAAGRRHAQHHRTVATTA